MRSAGRVGCGWVLGGVLCVSLWVAPSAAQEMPGSPEEALHQMARLAGVIFTGQVVAVRRHAGANGAAGVIEIEFAVEDAVRGASGERYTLREWAGLWAGDDEPFRVGQRYLMLLHAPGAGGLSSPVGGMDGAIPISGSSAAVSPSGAERVHSTDAINNIKAQSHLERSGAAADAAVSGEQVMDLSWVSTRVLRPTAYAAVATGAVAAGVARPLNSAVSHAIRDPVNAAEAATDAGFAAAQKVGYATVIAMLRNWEKENDEAH